jgi:GNAT superfamily N-acetyltransferase
MALGVEPEFRVCDPARAPARELIAAVLAEYDAEAGRPLRGGPSATTDDFSPPGGAYLVGHVKGVAVCGGGLKALSEDVAEIKRMYVVPDLRSLGFGRALLRALEIVADDLGYRVVRLDSGTGTWPMYLAAGYRQVADYNGNPHAQVWGEKPI